MNKRKVLISLAGVAILALSLLASGLFKKEPPDRSASKADIATAVNAKEVIPGEVNRTVKITGRLLPENTVSLYAEVGGTAEYGSRPFKAGVRFEKGDVLLKINSDEIESGLAAARSSLQSRLAGIIPDLKLDFPEAAEAWKDYLYEMDINKKLPPLPETDDRQVQLFLSGREIFTTYYNIRETETRLDKHVIRAPFAGTVTSTQIDASSLVRTGQPLGEFISTGRYELEAGVSYRDADALRIGLKFDMRDVNTGKTYTAEVIRINDAVDPLTQQIKIFAAVKSPEAKSGIYLEGRIAAETFQNAVSVPVEALVDEKYVFMVRDSIAELQPIRILHKTSETAVIGGIEKPGRLITDKHNEAFAGTKVTVADMKQ